MRESVGQIGQGVVLLLGRPEGQVWVGIDGAARWCHEVGAAVPPGEAFAYDLRR